MTPPQPPRPAVRLLPPIPREDEPSAASDVREVEHRAAHQIAQGGAATETDRVDALVADVRDMAPRVRRIDRRTRRLAPVLLAMARGMRGVTTDVRELRREVRTALGDAAEADGRLAADVSRALAPYRTRSTVSAGGSVLTTVVVVLYALAKLFAE